MITHIIPSMGLALSHVVQKKGLIVSGEVVNGRWLLKRKGKQWNVYNISGEGKQVNTFPIDETDNHFVLIPKKYSDTYEKAFAWFERKQR